MRGKDEKITTGIRFKDKKRDFRAIFLNWIVQWKMGIEIERQWKISHKTSFLSLTASFLGNYEKQVQEFVFCSPPLQTRVRLPRALT